jgi:hypothetical protein
LPTSKLSGEGIGFLCGLCYNLTSEAAKLYRSLLRDFDEEPEMMNNRFSNEYSDVKGKAGGRNSNCA